MRAWTVRVDDELATRAALLAEVEGTTIQAMLLEMLRARVEVAADDPRMLEHARTKIEAMRRAYGLDDYGGG